MSTKIYPTIGISNYPTIDTSKYTICILTEKDIRPLQLYFYHSISVGELMKWGYDMRNYQKDGNVYLDEDSYKIFMEWQYAKTNPINNTIVPKKH